MLAPPTSKTPKKITWDWIEQQEPNYLDAFSEWDGRDPYMRETGFDHNDIDWG